MSNFPDTFAEETTPITADLVPAVAAEIAQLNESGYEVHAGLTREYAEQIIQMAQEDGIKKYCPNDCTKRFKDMAAVEKWLLKKRGTFLLLKKMADGGLRLAGYGWVGLGTSQFAPGGITFSIRVGRLGQGQGLATPFARIIVLGAAKLYDAKGVWLATWQSNAAAVHIYHKIGFVDVASHQEDREEPDGTFVPDTRLHMTISDDLLAKPGHLEEVV